jgi:hypothetical protein
MKNGKLGTDHSRATPWCMRSTPPHHEPLQLDGEIQRICIREKTTAGIYAVLAVTVSTKFPAAILFYILQVFMAVRLFRRDCDNLAYRRLIKLYLDGKSTPKDWSNEQQICTGEGAQLP